VDIVFAQLKSGKINLHIHCWLVAIIFWMDWFIFWFVLLCVWYYWRVLD